MAIGPRLREARQQKQLTTSQVAEITRMKVQIVDDLENDDFHRIAATIYGKGFIKLFAECVELDPEPLLEDYMQQMGAPQPPKLPVQQEQEPLPPPETEGADRAVPEEDTTPADDLFSYADHSKRRAKRSVPTTTQPNAATQAPAASRIRWEDLLPAARRILQQVQDATTKILEGIVKKVTETGTHDKWIQRGLIALGVVVVILILIPLVRMLFTPRGPAPLPDDELILFIPTPEPYLE